MHYVFDSLASAMVAQAQIFAVACARGDGGLPEANSLAYARPVSHPSDGRAAIPAGAGGVPTETYRATGAVAGLPEPVALGEDWVPAGG